MILIEAEILARRELAVSCKLATYQQPEKVAYQTTATPAGIRKVPRHDPSPTGMEFPFGYDPELDDGE